MTPTKGSRFPKSVSSVTTGCPPLGIPRRPALLCPPGLARRPIPLTQTFLTAEPACLPCWHRQAEAAEEDEIFPVNPGTTALQSRNAFPPAWVKEEPVASDSAISAISAVKNLGSNSATRQSLFFSSRNFPLTFSQERSTRKAVAEVAELVDALRSGRSGGSPVGVRVPPSAPEVFSD